MPYSSLRQQTQKLPRATLGKTYFVVLYADIIPNTYESSYTNQGGTKNRYESA